MANKVIDSDLQVNGNIALQNIITALQRLILKSGENSVIQLVIPSSGSSADYSFTPSGFFQSTGVKFLGVENFPWNRAYCKKYIVPNGTSSQFLKADGTLDENAYALHTDLNTVKNNAWKLDIANPECETVVIALQPGQGIFEAMEKAGIDYSKSRNIYVDLSKVSSIGGTNIIDNLFSGYENLPVGVRYHIFFGNVQSSVKIYWLKPIESNIPYRVVGLTSDYPTAKCEFLRVTTDWTYADWEAAIDQVDFSLDTGTASESDNSTLMNYMDNNKVSYTKTPKGALVNITTLLAALVGNK